MARERLVVIGGGAGGAAAASQARRFAPETDIIIYDKGAFISYGACSEPYYIGGLIKDYRKLIARTPEEFRSDHNVEVKTGHLVTKIIPPRKEIVVQPENGEAFVDRYDKLIIASGVRPRRLGLPGEDLPGIFTLKELTDAIAIKEFIKTHYPRRAVTIGAGFIALEMAENFHRLKIANTIVEFSRFAGGRLEPELAEKLVEEFKLREIGFTPDTRTLSFRAHEAGGLVVETNRGDFPTDLVLISVGVIPNTEIAAAAGIQLGVAKAITVDERQRTNLPDIYAAGDCCEVINRVGGHRVNTPLGDLANKQGWVAGENAAGGQAVYPGVLGSAGFKFFDWEIAFTGLTPAEAERLGFSAAVYKTEVPSRIPSMPGAKPILINLVVEKKTGRLLGAQLMGQDGAALRLNSLAVALYQRMTLAEIVKLDFAYAPPFSPVMDPILRAANGALKVV